MDFVTPLTDTKSAMARRDAAMLLSHLVYDTTQVLIWFAKYDKPKLTDREQSTCINCDG